jgi:hypothetical protein
MGSVSSTTKSACTPALHAATHEQCGQELVLHVLHCRRLQIIPLATAHRTPLQKMRTDSSAIEPWPTGRYTIQGCRLAGKQDSVIEGTWHTSAVTIKHHQQNNNLLVGINTWPCTWFFAGSKHLYLIESTGRAGKGTHSPQRATTMPQQSPSIDLHSWTFSRPRASCCSSQPLRQFNLATQSNSTPHAATQPLASLPISVHPLTNLPTSSQVHPSCPARPHLIDPTRWSRQMDRAASRV